MYVKIGCCGFPGGKKAYYSLFEVVEVQETFYKLPQLSTAKKWREEAPQNFEFVIKAWQAVTHPVTSPTWRKAGVKIDKSKADRYGFLRPTEENFEAWRKIFEICQAVGAKICLIQCPPRFNYSDENVSNMRKFMKSIKRDGLKIAWEPRGDWLEHLDEVKKLCSELELIYVTDILRRELIVTSDIAYTRLHGLNPREYDYKYKYTDDDLKKLKEKVLALEKEGVKESYVLFNNVWMKEDALRFKQLLNE